MQRRTSIEEFNLFRKYIHIDTIGVQCDEQQGEKGPQATTVRIVDKPGAGASDSMEQLAKLPLGWRQ